MLTVLLIWTFAKAAKTKKVVSEGAVNIGLRVWPWVLGKYQLGINALCDIIKGTDAELWVE